MPEVDFQTSVARLRWHLAAENVIQSGRRLALLLKANFDPNQPRVPAGNPDGGQWTDSGGGYGELGRSRQREGSDPESSRIVVAARRLSPSRAAECERQYDRDIQICRMVQSPSCYSQAMVRLVACQQGGSIPPLSF